MDLMTILKMVVTKMSPSAYTMRLKFGLHMARRRTILSGILKMNLKMLYKVVAYV